MTKLLTSALLFAAILASPAAAYIGPGAGVGAFGTVIALFGAVFLLIAGFIWYPIKRVLRLRKAPAEAPSKTR